jgi:DNA-binding response OmpR family regulator
MIPHVESKDATLRLQLLRERSRQGAKVLFVAQETMQKDNRRRLGEGGVRRKLARPFRVRELYGRMERRRRRRQLRRGGMDAANGGRVRPAAQSPMRDVAAALSSWRNHHVTTLGATDGCW